jgi:hypothetical protein
MDKPYVIRSAFIVLALAGQVANAEFPPLPEQEDQAVGMKPSPTTNRWQGQYPEPQNNQAQNPWGGSGPIVREQVPKEFSTTKEKFPELDYSPYQEGQKRIRQRNRGMGMPETAVAPPARSPYQGYGSYYPPGGGYPSYGGGYGSYPGGGGWPGNYGGPWRGGGWPGNYGGSPWNGRGGNFPFSPFNW